ncbi:MAG: hypothetical protein IT384_34225 [Deltaproteobacteria bacterium]|nr:hypothetical protein [Deltaproteobacteria bacterium]
MARRSARPPIRRGLLLLTLSACGGATGSEGRTERHERDARGLLTCSEATAERTCFTQRAVMGVSMGGGGALVLGFTHPELFDVVGTLGSPLVDWVYMIRNMQRSYLGGFCDRDTILSHLDRVNDPSGPAFCGPVPGIEPSEPSGRLKEPSQDFNHWYIGSLGGPGLPLGRNLLRRSFKDIALAYGNAIYANEASLYFPPGVTAAERTRSDQERCAEPVIIRGLKQRDYNPDGRYEVIAFCDTSTESGDFSPAHPADDPVELLLAVDYNGNHRRDYAEPVLIMAHEPYQDIGLDPNDRYDALLNPSGRAGNWLHDEGEPFEDLGLDGLAGTGDHGEANGAYDHAPSMSRFLEQNPRSLLARVPDGHLARMNIYADAGIRDFLGSAGATSWFWGGLRGRVGADLARDYTRLGSLTGSADAAFDFLQIPTAPAQVGRHVFIRYGDPDASPRDIARGDGDHVGTGEQIIQRLLTALHFAQSRFLDRDQVARPSDEELASLLGSRSFYSEALGTERSYGLALPPGYDHPANADQRYPVLYFLHGQGQTPEQMLASAILFIGYMATSSDPTTQRRGDADWAKFILVFADSTCLTDDCDTGSFNTNHAGFDGHGPRYFDSLLELMVHVESTYRTAIPAEVPIVP